MMLTWCCAPSWLVNTVTHGPSLSCTLGADFPDTIIQSHTLAELWGLHVARFRVFPTGSLDGVAKTTASDVVSPAGLQDRKRVHIQI